MRSEKKLLILALSLVTCNNVYALENPLDETLTKSRNKKFDCLTAKYLNVCDNASVNGTVSVGGVNIAPLVSTITENSLSYGSVYNLGLITSQTLTGDDTATSFVHFSNAGISGGGILPLSDNGNPDPTAITITSEGIYFLHFYVIALPVLNTLTDIVFELTQGPIGSTTSIAQFIALSVTGLAINGSTIVYLPAGAVIRLHNATNGYDVYVPKLTSLTPPAPNAINAEIVIERIA